MSKVSVLWGLNVVLAVIMVGLLVAIFARAKRGKAAQNKLIESLDQEKTGANWVRIYLSRPEHFRRRMKLVGFEGRGVLAIGPDHVRVLADLDGGERIDRVYPKSDLALEWVGNPGLGSSNLHWIGLGKENNRLMLSADTGFNAVISREATADICRRIDNEFRLPEIAKGDFALERNPASLGAVLLFFILILFALTDGAIVNDYQLLDFKAAAWLVPSAMLLAIPSYWLLVRKGVPSRESLTLSWLLAVAVGAASIPALKRIDQLLSPATALSYDYTLVKGTRLESVQPGPPPLSFPRMPEYWAQFEEGSIHRFEILHGRFGLWQMDTRGTNERFRQFYETRGDAEKNGSTDKKRDMGTDLF